MKINEYELTIKRFKRFIKENQEISGVLIE